MRSTIAEMEMVTQELLQFAASIEPVTKALNKSGDASIRQYLSIRRRFDYAALIVSLYSAFESFVEDLLWSFAKAEGAFRPYDQLPDRLRKKHLLKSTDLIARGRLGEGRYAQITDLDMVSRLHGCLTGATPYELNRPAIVHHDNNLRANVIDTLFADIGISGVHGRTGNTDALLDWYLTRPDSASATENQVPPSVVELRLKDLVDRRNEISHSVPTTALGPMEMTDLVKFIAAYARSLFAVVTAEYLKRRYLDSGNALKLGMSVEELKKGKTVAVVPIPTFTIAASQPAFSVVEGAVRRWGTIESLMVDDAPQESAGGAESATGTVGIRTSFKLSPNATVYVLPHRDPLVW